MTGKTCANGNPGIDRRIRRTRAALQQAFIALIHQKGYDAITIEQICETANVGRSTFYAHYAGKEDLKRSGIDDHLRDLLFERRAAAKVVGAGEISPTLVIFEHAWEQRQLYRALVGGRGATIAIDAIKRTLSEMLREQSAYPRVPDGSNATAREIAIQFQVGAFASVLLWWLDHGARQPAAEIERQFRELSNGIGGGDQAELTA